VLALKRMPQPDSEARALLAAAYRAPYLVVGVGPFAVLSAGSANGHAPVVCYTARREEAELIAKAPELLAALLERSHPNKELA